MVIDLLEEKIITEIIDYALEYPKMVLSSIIRPQIELGIQSKDEMALGLYFGYISGVYFDQFLKRKSRFLDDDDEGWGALLP